MKLNGKYAKAILGLCVLSLAADESLHEHDYIVP
jgi:hypothetical protein